MTQCKEHFKQHLVTVAKAQKNNYSDLFALAAAVGRRAGSGRGRKPPTNKKDPDNSGNNAKKTSDPIKTMYSSSVIGSRGSSVRTAKTKLMPGFVSRCCDS